MIKKTISYAMTVGEKTSGLMIYKKKICIKYYAVLSQSVSVQWKKHLK